MAIRKTLEEPYSKFSIHSHETNFFLKYLSTKAFTAISDFDKFRKNSFEIEF